MGIFEGLQLADAVLPLIIGHSVSEILPHVGGVKANSLTQLLVNGVKLGIKYLMPAEKAKAAGKG